VDAKRWAGVVLAVGLAGLTFSVAYAAVGGVSFTTSSPPSSSHVSFINGSEGTVSGGDEHQTTTSMAPASTVQPHASVAPAHHSDEATEPEKEHEEPTTTSSSTTSTTSKDTTATTMEPCSTAKSGDDSDKVSDDDCEAKGAVQGTSDDPDEDEGLAPSTGGSQTHSEDGSGSHDD
jgi:hypothetical protein